MIQRLGETTHQSCLLLTSREKPTELGPLEGRTAPVRTLTLAGLAERACQTILAEKDILGADADGAALARLYGGNPLALKLVSESIRELFGSNISAFLASGTAFFNGVGRLLGEQFSRASTLEQTLLTWLAIAREPVTLARLMADVTGKARRGEVLAALEALRRRSLIERGAGEPAFTLQPVIMEYLTERLVEEVCQEIVDERPALLCSYALVQATAKDYVRRSQERLIAVPLLEQTIAICGSRAAAERQILDLLEVWRGQLALEQGYGPGNVVNLLRLLCDHLRGFDFSHLTIRQAYLQEVEAQDTRLVGAHIAESVFAGAFDYSVCIALSADGAYLAAGTASGEVQLWRLADRTLTVAVQAHAGGVYGIALSADGQRIVSGSVNGTLKLWSANSGVLLAVLQGHTGTIHSLAVSTAGQIIASASFDGTVRL